MIGAAVISGGGVYLAIGASAPESRGPARAAEPAAQAAPVVVSKRKRPAADRDSCVRSYFPEDTLPSAVSFAFVCEEGDFRAVSRQLFGMTNAPDPGKSAARPSPGLGWFELPATGIIRKSCCSESALIQLPQTPGWCEQLESAVRRIADDSAKAGDLAPAARSFEKAVNCLFANRIVRPYAYDRQPSAPQRKAFQEFLSRAAISEARR